jgi:F-type H+-transporting ATPase subunit gamma
MLVLQRKIKSANDLHSVVRTMKAMAGANITQYEQAILSLDDYYRTVQLGLTAYLQNQQAASSVNANNGVKSNVARTGDKKGLPIGAIIFGSDQGLVGQFNDALFSFANQTLSNYSTKPIFWAVGERIHSRLIEQKLTCTGSFTVPRSIDSVTPLVTQLLVEIEASRQHHMVEDVYLFYNRPMSKASYCPTMQRLLPLDKQWHELTTKTWPGTARPQLINNPQQSLTRLIHEYLFVSMYKACTASLASENASRLTAMQRAEKNIDELQEQLYRHYHHQRQQAVDEELFDLVGGFEALGS